MTARRRTGIVLAAVVGALLLVSLALRVFAPAPSGPPSSSYATQPRGLAAWHELLRDNGHTVRRLREPLELVSLRSDETVVVLDGQVTRRDAAVLRRHVRGGGRLIAGGAGIGWVERALALEVRFRADGPRVAEPLTPLPETLGVRRVSGAGEGSFGPGGAGLPLLAGTAGRDPIAVIAALGDGRVVLLADASPLQNRLLARHDNAVLALALTGGGSRPVAFLETPHGFRGRGLAALPGRWQLALLGLAAAGLLWMLARGRRFGPPEDERRPLPPARREYVDALAGALARTRGRERSAAVEPVRRAARERLVARSASRDPRDEEMLRRTAAAAAGLEPAEIEAVLGSGGEIGEALAAGRALAKLTRGRG